MSGSGLSSDLGPYQTIVRLHDHCLNVAARKYLLAAFYQEFATIMERLMENKTRPCLLCCDLLAFDLIQCPLPAVAATSTQKAQPAQDSGSLFALIFRATTFPPPFRASVALLPHPIQRMMQTTPVQALPAWFRARSVVRGGVGMGQPQAQLQAQGKVEQLEVSLFEYYFLSCAHFLAQPDIQVQAPPPPLNPPTKPPPGPPRPDEYNDQFLKTLEQYLHFFVPLHGVHSSSMKLEENGWNIPSIFAHGNTMLETLVETWFGQFSYEAAQPLPTAANPNAFGALQQPSSYNAPDEWTLPTRKMIIAFQTIVYHMLELAYVESPPNKAALEAVTATRASIIAYQQEKYDHHASGPTVTLRIDWHLFGVLQHCFNRWAPDWSTNVGLGSVPLIPISGSAGGASQYAVTTPRLDDRLTKLIELWLDYLEPWKSIYNEDYNPHIWRWWIVSNLPFYTVLLRDFLRCLQTLDIGREQTSARILHLKTILHVLVLFDGPVLEQVQEIEGLLFKNPSSHISSAQGHFTGLQRTETMGQQNQMAQQESFVVRNSLLHLCGLRPENYIPVFPSAAALLSSNVPVKSQSSFAMSPRSQSQVGIPVSPGSKLAQQLHPQKLESQGLAEELISMWSVGYASAAEVAPAKEKALLDAPSYPPAPKRKGDAPIPISPTLMQQEESAGQLIEHRLRVMFGLPEPTERREMGSPRNTNAAARGSEAGSNAPLSLNQLEPEYVTDESLHVPRLTASGRAQIKKGLRLCSKYDVPVLGSEEELPICTYEYAFLVRFTRWLSAQILERTGRKVDLRFMASHRFLVFVFITIAMLLWWLKPSN